MNSESEQTQRLERQLQELEAEINQQQPLQPIIQTSPSIQSVYNQFLNSYQTLPAAGKVALMLGGALIGLWVLSIVFQLIRLAVSLAVLGVIVYIGYKFFVGSQYSQDRDS